MKINIKKLLIFIIFLLVISLLNYCSTEVSSLGIENIKTGTFFKNNANEELNYEYEIIYEEKSRLLKVKLDKDGNTFQNKFIYINSTTNAEIFTLNYSYNTTNPKWKYAEQEKTIEFSNKLKNYNLNKDELQLLNFMLDAKYSTILSEINDKKYNIELFSIISYLKAAVSANLRMHNENSNIISGTISPSFLIGKSNFIFQEDFIIDINLVKNNISLIENSIDENTYLQDINLINYLKETSDNAVTFNKIYSFYYSNEQYLNHIKDMSSTFHEKDCSSSCIIGCGSDLGCCGNYSGCCYYSNTLCLIHDIVCADCSQWHCGPGCVPDTTPNRVVKLTIM